MGGGCFGASNIYFGMGNDLVCQSIFLVYRNGKRTDICKYGFCLNFSNPMLNAFAFLIGLGQMRDQFDRKLFVCHRIHLMMKMQKNIPGAYLFALLHLIHYRQTLCGMSPFGEK